MDQIAMENSLRKKVHTYMPPLGSEYKPHNKNIFFIGDKMSGELYEK